MLKRGYLLGAPEKAAEAQADLSTDWSLAPNRERQYLLLPSVEGNVVPTLTSAGATALAASGLARLDRP